MLHVLLLCSQVPSYSKTDDMNETNYGFVLVMMGIALTPGFSKFVKALLAKNMKTTDYTIMEVCVVYGLLATNC